MKPKGKDHGIPPKQCEQCGKLFYPSADYYYLCRACWRQQETTTGEGDTPSPVKVWPEDLPDWIPKLLQLSHPDRHANSSLANEVTRWLLKVRKEMKQQFQSY